MLKFQNEALMQLQDLAPTLQLGTITVKGHSAGGMPLLYGAQNGMRADRVDFLDASYGYWASSACAALRKRPDPPQINLVYIPGSKTEADALRAQRHGHLIQTRQSHGAIPTAFFAQ